MRYVAFALLLILLPSVMAEHTNRLSVEADVFAPVVRVSVPDFVSFGNVTSGFVSERVKIVINNTGTTAVQVVPELDKPDPVFSHLTFARRTTEEFQPIGSFKMTIPRPRALGKSEDDYLYAKLDLSTATGLSRDMPDHRATVIFWAVAA